MQEHSPQALAAAIDRLITLPDIYHRIRKQLESDEGSLSETAELISADPGITARLLQVVNSAMYGFSGQISSISRAVRILGLRQVHDLVLACSLGKLFGGLKPEIIDVGRFWRDSVLRSLAARGAARKRGIVDAERVFVEGLLADIGHLVMYQQMPRESAEILAAARLNGRPLHELEREHLSFDFSEVGAALLTLWRLPPGIPAAIGAQLEPAKAGEHAFEAAMLHIANQIVEADRRNATSQEVAAGIAAEVWSISGLQPESLPALREEAELHLAATVMLFFPSLQFR